MDRMYRFFRAGWLLLLLALVPGKGEAQVVVTEESLASTTEAGLAYARAGIATAGLKLAAAEAERLAAEARMADSIARANRVAPAPAPTSARTPPAAQAVDAGPSSASPAPPVTSGTSATSSPAPTTAAPSGPVTEILRARAAQRSGSAAADGVQKTDAPFADDVPEPVALAGPLEEAPPAAAAMEEAPVQTEAAAGTPALDGRESPLPDALDLGSWTTGIAGAASVEATRWATLFGEAANQHPGLMPALLLLMAAVGTTVLALGAGIRPWRRGRSPDGVGPAHGMDGSEPPRPHRIRQEARVPRDVEAVLASLEVRTGRPVRGTHPGDSHGSMAAVTRRRA